MLKKPLQKPDSLISLLSLLDEEGIKGTKRYRAVRSFLDTQAREKGIPLQGSFELTPFCNLDCKMCYVHLKPEQMKENQSLLTIEAWKSIMLGAIQEGMMYAALTGGECLTYPGFWELYEFLGDYGIETGILTNGILLDETLISRFKNRPPSGIYITLYGASDDAYERVTGHREFSRVLHNIRLMQEADLPFSLSITPSQFMTDGEEMLLLCRELGMNPSINSGLVKPREETGRILQEASLDEYVKMMRKQRALFPEFYKENEKSCWEDIEESLDSELQGVLCGAGRSNFHVSWNGGMRPCTIFPNIEEDIFSLGFHNAWENIKTRISKIHMPQKCVECEDAEYCKYCIAEHAAQAPVGEASPAICDWTRRMKKENLLKHYDS